MVKSIGIFLYFFFQQISLLIRDILVGKIENHEHCIPDRVDKVSENKKAKWRKGHGFDKQQFKGRDSRA